jgi:hypothetical protein
VLHRSSLSAALAAAALVLVPAAAHAASSPETAITFPTGPVFPGDGLRVVHDRRGEAILRFTGAPALKKARKWRGKQLQVTCDAVTPHALDGGGLIGGSARRGGGFNGRSLRIGLVGRTGDVCAVRARPGNNSDPRLVAVAPLTAKGRAWVADLTAAILVLSIGEPDRTPMGNVPTIDAMVDEGKPLVVALPDPGATPPEGRVGYWSDGARHDVLAVLSPTGRRLFVEVDGDVVRSNLLQFAFFLESDL